MRRTLTAALAAAALVLAVSPAARADMTAIGSLNLPAGGADAGVGIGDPLFQNLAGDTNYVVDSPVNGTLTSWSFRQTNITPGEQLRLRIVRPANVGPTAYTLVGTSTTQTVTGMGDVVDGPFATSLPIEAGDRLAIESLGPGGDVPVFSPVAGADDVFMTTPNLADGQSSGFDDGNGGMPNQTQALVQGTVTFTPTVDNPAPPTTPGPTTPTPIASLSPPVDARSVDVAPVSGTVLVRVPPSKTFVALAKLGRQLPIGSEIDVTNGRITLTAAAGPHTTQTKTADFYGGRFVVTQPAGAGGIVDLTLSGPLGTCSRFGGGDAVAAKSRTPPQPKKRFVWGSGHGTFRTVAKHGTAAVRGTIWLTEDRCDGSTLVEVRRGIVAVHDDIHHRTVLVKAGHRYLIHR